MSLDLSLDCICNQISELDSECKHHVHFDYIYFYIHDFIILLSNNSYLILVVINVDYFLTIRSVFTTEIM